MQVLLRRVYGVQGVLLRRMKSSMVDGKPIVDLPGCVQRRETVMLSEEERVFYEELKAQSQDVVKDLQDNSSGCAAA